MITTLLIEQVLFLILCTHARKNIPSLLLDSTNTESESHTSDSHPPAQNAESPLQVLRCRGPLLQNGDYLLSRLRSTIGVNGLNFSVRNGKRWNPVAIVTLITLYCHIHTNKLSFFSSKNPYTDASFKVISSSNTTELNVYHSLIKATSYGQLVMLGCDVTVYTPASYQRHRL